MKLKLNLSRRIALLIGCLILAVSLSLTIIGIILSSKAILNQTEEALLMSAEDGARLFEASIGKELAVLQELANREQTQTMDWNIQKSLSSDASRLGFLDIGIVLPKG